MKVGPFELLEVVGTGGMGDVWSARHTGGERVAIKLLTVHGAQQPEFRRAFRNEIRAVASLDHPAIVLVYDHGEVSVTEAATSQGRLVADTPYLAMELCQGGTLAKWRGHLPWRHLHEVLLGLLDALAHAHARGVVHRDLKPANVLVRHTPRVDQGPGFDIRLTDFGLAQALGVLEQPVPGGTPVYMAPEQFAGHWRDYGPWTDLYALGCLAWTLTTGHPPFRGNPVEIAARHLSAPLPALKPSLPVPAGFDAWLGRLLEKAPGRRFRRASDAAWALRKLPEQLDDSALVDDQGPDGDTLPRTMLADFTTLVWPTEEIFPRALDSQPQAEVPPLPRSWRRARARRGSIRLAGAGLGLFGLRPVPLVGRELERDAIWNALHTVHEGARLIALRGPSGCGKSRLARWASERAHELGAAEVLTAFHAPIAGPPHGLPAMLGRQLRCVGLGHLAIRTRLQEVLPLHGLEDGVDPLALATLIQPEGASLHFGHAVERWEVVTSWLRRLCRERPAVVWLDDVQWGLDALGLAQHVLERHPELPVLFLLTAAEEALAERPEEAEAFQRLLLLGNTRALRIGPLPQALWPVLVRTLLGLEGDLARQVEARTAGNPMFAVQLVGDWVQRSLLEPGARGFRLRAGAQANLPDDLHAVWRQRIERALSGRPQADGHAIELAATLGLAVDGSEWRAACEVLGLRPPEDVLEALLSQRLATATRRGGFVFVHRMLCEALERRAHEHGRSADHHRACAEVLRHAGRPALGRLGQHLLAAGDPEAAVPALTTGLRDAVDIGDYGLAETLLGARERALHACGAAHNDTRWGEGWLQRFRIEHLRGDLDAASAWLDRTQEGAVLYSWELLGAWVALHRQQLVQERDGAASIATTRDIERQAIALASTNPDGHVLRAEANLLLGALLEADDQLEQGGRCYQRARDLYLSQQHLRGQSLCWQALGELAGRAGRAREALQLLGRAEQLYKQRGYRWGLASTLRAKGDVHRGSGKLELAADAYRASAQLFAAIGSEAEIGPRLGLALTLAESDNTDAIVLLELLLPQLERQEHPKLREARVALALLSAP